MKILAIETSGQTASAAIIEDGKLLAEACVDGEELLVHTIDLDEVASYRVREIVYLRDRRPETYDLLTNLY